MINDRFGPEFDSELEAECESSDCGLIDFI